MRSVLAFVLLLGMAAFGVVFLIGLVARRRAENTVEDALSSVQQALHNRPPAPRTMRPPSSSGVWSTRSSVSPVSPVSPVQAPISDEEIIAALNSMNEPVKDHPGRNSAVSKARSRVGNAATGAAGGMTIDELVVAREAREIKAQADEDAAAKLRRDDWEKRQREPENEESTQKEKDSSASVFSFPSPLSRRGGPEDP